MDGLNGMSKAKTKQRAIFFSRNFYLTQAVVLGLFIFVVSTVSGLTPAPQAATPQAATPQTTAPQTTAPATTPPPVTPPPAAGAPPATAAAPADGDADFPNNPGKEVFLNTCSKCHSPRNVLAYRQDADGWTATITKMVGYGATGSDEDFTAILDYLTKSFPPAPSK
jgi:cytochrome c5